MTWDGNVSDPALICYRHIIWWFPITPTATFFMKLRQNFMTNRTGHRELGILKNFHYHSNKWYTTKDISLNVYFTQRPSFVRIALFVTVLINSSLDHPKPVSPLLGLHHRRRPTRRANATRQQNTQFPIKINRPNNITYNREIGSKNSPSPAA